LIQEKTAHVARGKWRGILAEFGVSLKLLDGKHHPCPVCGGKDRFRFDDKEGKGTFICSQCGAGDGFELARRMVNGDFVTVAKKIDDIVGNIRHDTVRPAHELSDDERRALLRRMYQESTVVTEGDRVDAYMRARGIVETAFPTTLRYGQAVRDGEGGIRPAMLAMVGVYGADRYCSIHRTFLHPREPKKAEMTSPRKMTSGPIEDGACVALSDFHGGVLGIAEGIETALSASLLYEIPVWSAINASMLAKWSPPKGCDELVVFGDNDVNFKGQAAAYALANRVSARLKIPVSVHIPDQIGADWNDVLRGKTNATGRYGGV